MITINLLPPELRVKLKEQSAPAAPAPYVYLAALVAVAFIAAQVYLAVRTSGAARKVKVLSAQAAQLQPLQQKLEESRARHAGQLDDAASAQKLLSRRIIWADKLAGLSRYLPQGIWFTGISVSLRDFSLHGTVYSFSQDDVSLIGEFVTKLKKDTDFIKDFKNLELGTVKRRSMGPYEVADFSISGVLKTE